MARIYPNHGSTHSDEVTRKWTALLAIGARALVILPSLLASGCVTEHAVAPMEGTGAFEDMYPEGLWLPLIPGEDETPTNALDLDVSGRYLYAYRMDGLWRVDHRGGVERIHPGPVRRVDVAGKSAVAYFIEQDPMGSALHRVELAHGVVTRVGPTTHNGLGNPWGTRLSDCVLLAQGGDAPWRNPRDRETSTALPRWELVCRHSHQSIEIPEGGFVSAGERGAVLVVPGEQFQEACRIRADGGIEPCEPVGDVHDIVVHSDAARTWACRNWKISGGGRLLRSHVPVWPVPCEVIGVVGGGRGTSLSPHAPQLELGPRLRHVRNVGDTTLFSFDHGTFLWRAGEFESLVDYAADIEVAGEHALLSGDNAFGVAVNGRVEAAQSLPEGGRTVSWYWASDGALRACHFGRGTIRYDALSDGNGTELDYRRRSQEPGRCGRLGRVHWFLSSSGHGLYGHVARTRPGLTVVAPPSSRFVGSVESAFRMATLRDWYVDDVHEFQFDYPRVPWNRTRPEPAVQYTFLTGSYRTLEDEVAYASPRPFPGSVHDEGRLTVHAIDDFGNGWTEHRSITVWSMGAVSSFVGIAAAATTALMGCSLFVVLAGAFRRSSWMRRTARRRWLEALAWGTLGLGWAIFRRRVYRGLLTEHAKTTHDAATAGASAVGYSWPRDRIVSMSGNVIAGALRAHCAVCIQGPSGIGKSIYLRALLKPLAEHLGDPTPVVVEFRRASEEPEMSIHAILEQMGGLTDPRLLDSLLADTTFLFVIDGWNEVAPEIQAVWRAFIRRHVERKSGHYFLIGSRVPVKDVYSLNYGLLPAGDAQRMLRERLREKCIETDGLEFDQDTIELARLPQQLNLLVSIAEAAGGAAAAESLPTTRPDLLARVLAHLTALLGNSAEIELVALRAAGLRAADTRRLEILSEDNVSETVLEKLEKMELVVPLEGKPAFAHDSVRALFAASALLNGDLHELRTREYKALSVWEEVIDHVAALVPPGARAPVVKIVGGLATSGDPNGVTLASRLVSAVTARVGHAPSWVDQLARTITLARGRLEDPDAPKLAPWLDAEEIDFTRPEPDLLVRLLARAFRGARAETLTRALGLAVPTGSDDLARMRALSTEAAKARQLLDLAVEVFADEDASEIHGELRVLLDGHEAELAATALRRARSVRALAAVPPVFEARPAYYRKAVTVANTGLEGTINVAAGFVDPREHRLKLAEAEVRTARIEVDGWPAGTGFLVGPRYLLTAAHVVHGHSAGAHVVAVFDYKMQPSGARAVYDGRPVEFADNWRVCESAHADVVLELGEVGPPEKYLDFALIELATDVGDQPIGPDWKSPGERRGWYALRRDRYRFEPDESLHILGYPAGRPVQYSFAAPAGACLTESKSRVRYQPNTEAGSSGSPVFNREFRVVALHHAAGPVSEFDPRRPLDRTNAPFNQGVPIALIVRALTVKLKRRRGVLAQLGLA